jgi:hypothetical protein
MRVTYLFMNVPIVCYCLLYLRDESVWRAGKNEAAHHSDGEQMAYDAMYSLSGRVYFSTNSAD